VSDLDPVAELVQGYSQLLSLAVHELRTPTSVVGGYLRMLQRDTDAGLSDRQRKMIDEAAKSCSRLAELISEMSDVSKLDGGTAAVKLETFDLFPVLQEVAAAVHEGADRGVRLVVHGESGGATMTGDLIRLRQALTACLRAVLREQPADSTVVAEQRLTAVDGRDHARLVVAREQDLQVAGAAPVAPFNDQQGGLGLALPLARRVVERHGGRIWSPVVEDGARTRAIVVSIPLPENHSVKKP
jgi:signal transduction histidine kinase